MQFSILFIACARKQSSVQFHPRHATQCKRFTQWKEVSRYLFATSDFELYIKQWSFSTSVSVASTSVFCQSVEILIFEVLKMANCRQALNPLDQRRNEQLLAQNRWPRAAMSATNVYELSHQLPYKRFRLALAMLRWKTNVEIERERNIQEEQNFMKIASTYVNEIDLNFTVKTVSRPSKLKRAKNSFRRLFCGCAVPTSVN